MIKGFRPITKKKVILHRRPQENVRDFLSTLSLKLALDWAHRSRKKSQKENGSQRWRIADWVTTDGYLVAKEPGGEVCVHREKKTFICNGARGLNWTLCRRR